MPFPVAIFTRRGEFGAGQSRGLQVWSKRLQHIQAGNTARTQSSCFPAAGNRIAHAASCITLSANAKVNTPLWQEVAAQQQGYKLDEPLEHGTLAWMPLYISGGPLPGMIRGMLNSAYRRGKGLEHI